MITLMIRISIAKTSQNNSRLVQSRVREIFLLESGIRENFALGIRNSGLWNLENSSRNPESTNDWNPESKLH